MDIKQKLALEKSAEKIIRLYREGIFYVAYNHSALRFKYFIHPEVKILKHVLKNGNSYFRMGVVQNSAVLTPLNVKDKDGIWKNYMEVPCGITETCLDNVTPDKVIEKSHKKATDEFANRTVSEVNSLSVKIIIEKIRKVNIGNMTPIQALQLIDEWQQILNE